MKRKIEYLMFVLFCLIINNALNAQDETWKYLNQTPPGDIPEVFAPGIVSVSDRYEYGLSISPDGKQIIFKGEEDGPNGLLTIVKKDTGWCECIYCTCCH